MQRGGRRLGSGRKQESPKVSIMIRLSEELARDLRSMIKAQYRSRWIEPIIRRELKKFQRRAETDNDSVLRTLAKDY